MPETTDDIDERALIEAAQANPARFVDLYDRYFHRVYAYVIRRTRSREEAEDITSTVFERALAHRRHSMRSTTRLVCRQFPVFG